MEKEIDRCSKCNSEKSKPYGGWRNVRKCLNCRKVWNTFAKYYK